MRESKFIIASLIVHGLLFASMIFDWKPSSKQQYMDSDVLLMGPKTGDKINPQKKASAEKKVVKAVENDPDALKTYDKNAPNPEDVGEGTFGQGGTKPLDYDTELAAWLRANKRYPKMAKRLGQEADNIVVAFKVFPDGRLDDISLKEKSPYEILNQAAVDQVRAASPFKPFPPNFPKTPLNREQPFSYKLGE